MNALKNLSLILLLSLAFTGCSRFLGGRGALMGFFAFLPYIGEAVALLLGL